MALKKLMVTLGRGVDTDKICNTCASEEESHYHLFVQCKRSVPVWGASCPFFDLGGIRQDSYLDDFLNSFLVLTKWLLDYIVEFRSAGELGHQLWQQERAVEQAVWQPSLGNTSKD
ncbi:hypothetical protein SLEP1_g25946 [Rubroshorea leprosula]|uniref:Reverse transcriptase zinc-binding domain-containing protein n=1 Tax=Rubroshorea leprosula TaxID=152421 RepID=A0AAV5JK93_9ROSI|nr:hypothetical protein SLEP1_g25946 [Rubroshorea leprosula]